MNLNNNVNEKKKEWLTAQEVADDFGVSRAKAYRMIKQLNEELESKGYMTVAGRVSRRYYIERTYTSLGMEGETNASI